MQISHCRFYFVRIYENSVVVFSTIIINTYYTVTSRALGDNRGTGYSICYIFSIPCRALLYITRYYSIPGYTGSFGRGIFCAIFRSRFYNRICVGLTHFSPLTYLFLSSPLQTFIVMCRLHILYMHAACVRHTVVIL